MSFPESDEPHITINQENELAAQKEQILKQILEFRSKNAFK